MIKRAKDWTLLRIVSPAALWLGQRHWGIQEAWYIMGNQPLPWALQWLGRDSTDGALHRVWFFADAKRELRFMFQGRKVNVMWRSLEHGDGPRYVFVE